MAQGWAGSHATPPGLKCAACILEDRAVDPVTQIKGTLVCLAHAKQMSGADED